MNLICVFTAKNHAFAHGNSRNVYAWAKGLYMILFCSTSSPDIHVELEHHYRGNRKVSLKTHFLQFLKLFLSF